MCRNGPAVGVMNRLALLLLALPGLAGAAETPVPQGSTFGALLQALLGLAIVLAALFAFLWFLRRFSPAQSGVQGVVRVVGGVMVGPRERVVVVEVGEQWLLLGVASGQVSHLQTLPKPADAPPPAQVPLPPFAGKLAEILARRKNP